MGKNIISWIFILFAALTLSACGFQPLYATPEGAQDHPVLRQIRLGEIISTRVADEGNLSVQPLLRRALEKRLLINQAQSEEYILVVEVTPVARRLAIQIDASVNRFNYSLSSRYRLVHAETGAFIQGRPSALVSYSQVTAQYASLYAERTAVEKASMRLAEEIERDILSKYNKLEDDIAERRAKAIKPDSDPTKFDDEENPNIELIPDFDRENITPQ